MQDLIFKKCQELGIKIYPFKMESVILGIKKFPIPEDVLNSFDSEKLKKYIDGLYLSSQEYAKDWVQGHKKLKEIGFIETIRKSEHRNFISLKFGEIIKK